MRVPTHHIGCIKYEVGKIVAVTAQRGHGRTPYSFARTNAGPDESRHSPQQTTSIDSTQTTLQLYHHPTTRRQLCVEQRVETLTGFPAELSLSCLDDGGLFELQPLSWGFARSGQDRTGQDKTGMMEFGTKGGQPIDEKMIG